jgi:dolichol-phosphate mannosyltransferase
MDGDLQHPPEMIPVLIATATQTNSDVTIASRYTGSGGADGLNGRARRVVSASAIALTRGMFPVRLRDCTDPMTGFFVVRRTAVPLDALRPRGFKILLEILARQTLSVTEEPFVFGNRFAGESKASVAQGTRFLMQLAALRFGRMSRFAAVGAFGVVANIAIMALLIRAGVGYIPAAAVAAAVTILANFVLQEQLVFRDLRSEGRSLRVRLLSSVGFNTVEALLRLPVLWLLVQAAGIPSLVAQSITLMIAFLARFGFQSRVVYRPRRRTPVSPVLLPSLDASNDASSPSEEQPPPQR